jgi:hypothetical protein
MDLQPWRSITKLSSTRYPIFVTRISETFVEDYKIYTLSYRVLEGTPYFLLACRADIPEDLKSVSNTLKIYIQFMTSIGTENSGYSRYPESRMRLKTRTDHGTGM